MEIRINVNGKVWIVPGDKIGSLVSWLTSNAVEVSQKQEVRETVRDNTEPRQLLVE